MMKVAAALFLAAGRPLDADRCWTGGGVNSDQARDQVP
jgi:hypothetical protein